VDKPYVFRALNGGDISPMLKIIKKLGLKDVGAVFMQHGLMESKHPTSGGKKQDGDQVEQIGAAVAFELAELIIDALDRVQGDLNTLMASCSNLSVEQINALPLDGYVGMVSDFITKPEMSDCFKAVAKFMK